MSSTRGTLRWGLMAMTAGLSVAAVMLGLNAVSPKVSRHGTTTPDATLAAALRSGTNLDVGRLTRHQAINACSSSAFASDKSDVRVLYGVSQRTRKGSVPVVVLKNAAGDYRLCDVYGADSPSALPVGKASAKKPVAYFSSGRRVWTCAPHHNKLKRFTTSQWLSVGRSVDRVSWRFFVNGAPRPWFTTKAYDGLAHLQIWLNGPLAAHKRLAVKERVLDAAGYVVKQSAIPTRRQHLSGCKGGDVQIG
jgi:hypothetical protein